MASARFAEYAAANQYGHHVVLIVNAGRLTNARDTTTEFRFVESLYSAGQWISPHRLRSSQDLLWYADSRLDDGLYRCRNDYGSANAAVAFT
ncbi:MAG: type I-F CRISPR-associated protein Csy2, partial [Desulfovibrionaceae bacterium]|nr:type I-F CRISPR-associated protein Csy2 [Desulfovibrionaceae bacterium]